MARGEPRSSGTCSALIDFKRLGQLQQAPARTLAETVIGADKFQRLFLAQNITVHRFCVIGGKQVVLLDAVEEILDRDVKRL